MKFLKISHNKQPKTTENKQSNISEYNIDDTIPKNVYNNKCYKVSILEIIITVDTRLCSVT